MPVNPDNKSITATFTGGDIEIGAVELKNATTDERAHIGVGSTIADADILLGVKDPAIGLVADAAVSTDAVGTLSAKLRGLVSLADTRIPALGAAAAANSTPVTLATEDAAKIPSLGAAAAAASTPVTLSTEDAAKVPSLGVATSANASPVVLSSDDAQLGALGAASDVDGNVHGQLRYIGEASDVALSNVGNAPASPGDCVAVAAGGAGASVEITQADLVPGTKYRLRVTPDIPTDAVMGIWKCSAAVAIADATDGTPILSHEEVIIRLPLGSTKVRLYFWMLAATDVACHVWLSESAA